MLSHGGVLRRSSSVVERARDGARRMRKSIARFSRPQSFAAPPDAEAAAIRAVRNLRFFRLHYAFLLWFILLAALFPHHRATMLFLMAASKVALLCGAALRVFPSSPLLLRIINRRLVAALFLAAIGAELVVTGAVVQVLLAMDVGVPLVLLHAVFRKRDDLMVSGEEAAGADDGFGPIAEKKGDLELGNRASTSRKQNPVFVGHAEFDVPLFIFQAWRTAVRSVSLAFTLTQQFEWTVITFPKSLLF